MFGNYYVYDCISPLADVLKAQLGFSDSDIGLLQAIYSFPNIIMVLVGGFIIDRLGTKRSTLIFAVLCLLGAVITAAAETEMLQTAGGFIVTWLLPTSFHDVSRTLVMMAAGRLVFGLGA